MTAPARRAARWSSPAAAEPDWGPANVQPRYEIEADIAKGTTLPKALNKGLKLTVTTNVAGTLSGVLKVKDKKVASGSSDFQPGNGTIKFRFTKKAPHEFADKKKLAVFVDLTFKPRPGAAFPVSGTVEVKR